MNVQQHEGMRKLKSGTLFVCVCVCWVTLIGALVPARWVLGETMLLTWTLEAVFVWTVRFIILELMLFKRLQFNFWHDESADRVSNLWPLSYFRVCPASSKQCSSATLNLNIEHITITFNRWSYRQTYSDCTVLWKRMFFFIFQGIQIKLLM